MTTNEGQELRSSPEPHAGAAAPRTALAAHTPWIARDHIDLHGPGSAVKERGEFFWIEIEIGKHSLSGFITQDMANMVVAAPDMLAELRLLHAKCGWQSTADLIVRATGAAS